MILNDGMDAPSRRPIDLLVNIFCFMHSTQDHTDPVRVKPRPERWRLTRTGSSGGGQGWEDPRQKLSEIIKKIHSLFTGKYTDAEIAGLFTAVTGNVVADERIQVQAKANPTAAQFANGDYKTVLAEAVIKALSSHHAMSEQMLQNPKVFEEVAEVLLTDVYEQARTASQAAQ